MGTIISDGQLMERVGEWFRNPDLLRTACGLMDAAGHHGSRADEGGGKTAAAIGVPIPAPTTAARAAHAESKGTRRRRSAARGKSRSASARRRGKTVAGATA